MRGAVCLDYQSVYCTKQETVSSWSLSLVSAVFLLLALGFKIWIGINSTALGYQLAEERTRAVNYDMQRRELELQLSILLRPDNLAQHAKESLGLQALNPKQARRIVN
jgi:hypothetical protein